MTKTDYQLIDKIIQRAKDMGITVGQKVTYRLDIVFAHQQFNLDLQRWLQANDNDFADDFCGIQNNMDREKCMVLDSFVPKFIK